LFFLCHPLYLLLYIIRKKRRPPCAQNIWRQKKRNRSRGNFDSKRRIRVKTLLLRYRIRHRAKGCLLHEFYGLVWVYTTQRLILALSDDDLVCRTILFETIKVEDIYIKSQYSVGRSVLSVHYRLLLSKFIRRTMYFNAKHTMNIE